jgi:1-acyl-sn-glycerol-3-phosphate acyltransferase
MQTFLIFPLMGAFSPLTVIDRYRVKTVRGGAVFVSNHSSALDAVVMLQALPNRFRFRAFVVAAADSIFKRKWEAILTQLLINTFPIPRAGGARPALDLSRGHALAHGQHRNL